MARNYSVNWRALRYRFADATEYVADRKGRFIALALASAPATVAAADTVEAADAHPEAKPYDAELDATA